MLLRVIEVLLAPELLGVIPGFGWCTRQHPGAAVLRCWAIVPSRSAAPTVVSCWGTTFLWFFVHELGSHCLLLSVCELCLCALSTPSLSVSSVHTSSVRELCPQALSMGALFVWASVCVGSVQELCSCELCSCELRP